MSVESDNNSTIRQTRNAINLLINGAMRQIEDRYVSTDKPPCRAACNAVIDHAIEELQSWMKIDPLTGEPV